MAKKSFKKLFNILAIRETQVKTTLRRAYTSNPGYFGSRDQEDHSLKP
jgi:hypothetical protein